MCEELGVFRSRRTDMETISGSSSVTKRDEPPLRVGSLLTSSAPAACSLPASLALPC